MTSTGAGRDPERVLASLVERLAEILRVPAATIRVDVESDLLGEDGVDLGGQTLDSLALVELLATLEDDYGVAIEEVIGDDGSLTIADIVTACVAA